MDDNSSLIAFLAAFGFYLLVWAVIWGTPGYLMLARVGRGLLGCVLGILLGPIGLVTAWVIRDNALRDLSKLDRAARVASHREIGLSQNSKPHNQEAQLALLEKLGQLWKEGVLTQSEFEERKVDILRGDNSAAKENSIPSAKPPSQSADATERALRTYLGSNSDYYIAEWRRIQAGRNSTFNKSAFVFGIVWMLYRKLWLEALVAMVLVVSASALARRFVSTNNGDLLAFGIIVGFAAWLVYGVFANRLYLRKAQAVASQFSQRGTVYDAETSLRLATVGGTSILGLLIGCCLWAGVFATSIYQWSKSNVSLAAPSQPSTASSYSPTSSDAATIPSVAPPDIDVSRVAAAKTETISAQSTNLDINGDGIQDRARLRLESSSVTLEVTLGGAQSRTVNLTFSVGTQSEDSFCTTPVSMTPEDLSDVTQEAGELEGYEVSTLLRGLRLSDSECDNFHVYWNHKTDDIAWWRL